MSGDLSADRPWQGGEGVSGMPPGMLGAIEGGLLYRLARDWYRGYGEIIDAGAFLGASSYCLAKGLDENQRLRDRSGRLHAYDLFQLWREQGDSYAYMAGQLERHFQLAVGEEQSTFHHYAANLGELARHVRLHPGDITQARWSGRPVELLFIDIAKTQRILQHLVAEFFPSLIPGVSIVVQQDWHHPLLPHVHIVQQFFSDYFEVVEPHTDDSAAFRLTRPIPDRLLDEAARYDFSAHEQLALMDAAIASAGADGGHLEFARAILLARLGRLEEAWEAVATARRRWAGASDAKLDFSGGLSLLAVSRLLAQSRPPPPGYDEAHYLAANPNVANGVRKGRFVSGHQHWIMSGEAEGRALR